ncbi:zinc transporter 1 isoform X2 [Copidosoma floridanum]|nr:zinc transporter 1 isoform X2 [Copidosoma floridanum]
MCSLRSSSVSLNDQVSMAPSAKKSKKLRPEKRMMNTFGWARIDIVTMLICCVLLASFCFSLIVEALQTLVHIHHLDAMHHPLPVMTIGASGILLNAFCYFLIGGYTFNQGVFLHFTQEGNVVLKKATDSQQPQQEGTAGQMRSSPIIMPKTQGFREMCRDVLGCILVIIASVAVYFTDKEIAKFVDPIFAVVSAVSLFVLSYPYMKESGLILLQTIPNHINIDSLQKELLAAFPDILNVHDLHVWQLNGEKVVATIHIIYADATVYARITDRITMFFVEQGISHVTIQPEFCNTRVEPTDCLIKCRSKKCSASTCCSREILSSSSDEDQHHHHEPHAGRKCAPTELWPAPEHLNVQVDEICETRRDWLRPPVGEAQEEEASPSGKDHCSRTVDVDVLENTEPVADAEGAQESTAVEDKTDR